MEIKRKEKAVLLILAAGIWLLGSAYFKRAEQTQGVYGTDIRAQQPVVVLDAGHGGKDPGKVSNAGALEKDINLSITKRLKILLEQNGIVVVMTREEDMDLASERASNRKNEDLKARAALIAETAPTIMVSIHQNSYPEEDVDGAQVFYASGSDDGKQLATIIQKNLKNEIKDDNHRMAKANKEYYLLKKTTCPAVIVECGFLSNPREAELLTSEDYQEKLAFAIHLGILEYINTQTITEE